jgi:predicted RND superfamily exporter protein
MTLVSPSLGAPAARRQRRLLLIYGLVALPLVIYGAVRTLESNSNSPLEWVPPGHPARRDYDEFRAAFGPGDTVIASWDGCALDEERLDELCRVLRCARVFHDDQGDWYFDRVVSGREAVATLGATPPGNHHGDAKLAGTTDRLPPACRSQPLTRAAALKRLQGTLVGPDGKTTCVVISFNKQGLGERSRLVPLIQQAITRFCEIAPEDQHLAGPVIDGRTVDVASSRALDCFALPSALLVLLVCYLCLDSMPGALLVFGVAMVSQAATLAMVFYSGESMSALLIVLPPLIQVLAVSGGIHLINYYFEVLPTVGPVAAPGQALQLGWLPCVLSAGTTTIGLASLLVSEVTPIRLFGAYAAAGVLVSLSLLLLVIPAFLAYWPIRRRNRADVDDPGAAASTGVWQWLTNFLARHFAIISLAALALMLGSGWGAGRMKSSVRVETLFPTASRILSDYQWLEEHLGPLVPIEVVVQLENNCQLTLNQRMALLWEIQQRLKTIEAVSATSSALTFLPQLAAPGDVPSEARQGYLEQVVARAKPLLEVQRTLHQDDGREQWRVTAFVSALQGVDYTEVLSLIRTEINPLLRPASSAPMPGVSARFTGIMPLVQAIQQQLLADLLASFVTALVIITLVMTVVQAGVLAGLTAMVPNLFPVAILFGILGWAEVPLDIGSIMTASIALGIAVDDTLHFLTFFRRGLQSGRNRKNAVTFAYQHCGMAMIQTSLSCGIGLLIFALSDFVPTCRFAWMMATLLGLALAGDLVVMPALLLSPAGKLFERNFRPDFQPDPGR